MFFTSSGDKTIYNNGTDSTGDDVHIHSILIIIALFHAFRYLLKNMSESLCVTMTLQTVETSTEIYITFSHWDMLANLHVVNYIFFITLIDFSYV